MFYYAFGHLFRFMQAKPCQQVPGYIERFFFTLRFDYHPPARIHWYLNAVIIQKQEMFCSNSGLDYAAGFDQVYFSIGTDFKRSSAWT